jgi:hypothetical protein
MNREAQEHDELAWREKRGRRRLTEAPLHHHVLGPSRSKGAIQERERERERNPRIVESRSQPKDPSSLSLVRQV